MVTDHQHLKYIMDLGKVVPVMAVARIQCWCLFLVAFSYCIEFWGTTQHANCDSLSCLPHARAPDDKPDEVEMFHTAVGEALPVTEKELRKQTCRDWILSRVLELIQMGWQEVEAHTELIPFAQSKSELGTHKGAPMWDSRVVVPTKPRQRVLETLHKGNPRTKKSATEPLTRVNSIRVMSC